MRAARLALLLALALGPARAARAQLEHHPASMRPELPAFAPGEAGSLGLPALPEPGAAARRRPSSGLRVYVREIRVEDSTVFSAAELARLTAPWTGREVGTEELVAAQNAITRAYIARGHVSSGAQLPDQDVVDGVVRIRAVEGRLESLSIEGNRHFRRDALRARLLPDASRPLALDELERRLRLLQADERIVRVDARLTPGSAPGLARLGVTVLEETPWRLGVRVANDVSSSLGGRRLEVALAHLNPLGLGDRLGARISLARGLVDLDLRYTLPLGAHGTTLELGYRRGRAEVVEGLFDALGLDVDSRRSDWTVALRQVLYRRADRELSAGIEGQRRTSRVEIADLGPFDFFASQTGEDETHVSVLRPHVQWISRTPGSALAARYTVSFGVDWLDATIYPSSAPGSDVPDGRFVSHLIQLQYARQLPDALRAAQLVLRGDAQLARDALLPMERIPVGGRSSVRGYHTSEMVRDSGIVLSAEARIPLLRDARGRERLQLVPFADFGKAWNRDRRASQRSIASLGLGLRLDLGRVRAGIYWGGRLRPVDRRDGDGLQDAGLHLELEVAAF